MKCYEAGRARFKPFGWCEANHDHRLESSMKSGAWDKTAGTLHEMQGKVREVAGRITDS